MRARRNDSEIGERYNDWEVIGWQIGVKGVEWVCRCRCGRVKVQKVYNVKNGKSRKCRECSLEERREWRKWEDTQEGR